MNLDRKQKILLPITIVVLGILGWQLYGLLGTHTENNMSRKSVPMAPTFPTGNSAATNNTVTELAERQAATSVKDKPSLSSAAISEQDKDRLRAVSANDTEYLKLIQEYQLLQIQRRIAEDTRAIAIAKLETAKAVVETNKFAGVNNFNSGIDATGSSVDHDYKLVFTGQEAGQWTATLKINDQLMDVVPGTTLPDGYKVTTVDGDSVIIQKGSKQKTVNFLGVHESEIDNKSSSNSVITNQQANADALLQVIAPEKVKKKTTEQPTALAAKNQSPASAKTAPTETTSSVVAPLQSTKATASTATSKATSKLPAADKQTTLSTDLSKDKVSKQTKPTDESDKQDKNALTAAFLKADTSETTASNQTANEAAKKQAKHSQVKANSEKAVTTPAMPTEIKTVPASEPTSLTKLTHAEPVSTKTLQQHSIKPAAKPMQINPAKLKPMPQASRKKQPFTDKSNVVNETVKTQVSGNYTIQLMSDRNEAAVKAFIKKYGLTDKATYTRKVSNGKVWFVLTYGQYATYAEAQAALHDLPGAVRDWKPFARRIKNSMDTSQPKAAKLITSTAIKARQVHAKNDEADQESSQIAY